jgi:PAS domain S-box-containing protein
MSLLSILRTLKAKYGGISTSPAMIRFVPILVMLIVGLLSWTMANSYRQNLIDQNKTDLKSDMDEIASFLTSRINTRQAILNGLAAMVKSHAVDGLPLKDFQTFAEGLKANDPSIRVIQFFPAQGKVLLYPIEGNEKVANSSLQNLLTDSRPNVKADVDRTIASRQITLSNPYQLTQGGLGVVARLAVYEQDKFLGLVTIVLNQDALMDIPGLTKPREGIRFAIRDHDGRTFFGDEQVFFLKPVLSTIILPEGTWTLGAVPSGGWEADLTTRMALVWLMGILLTLLAGHITNLSISTRIRLQRLVDERTSALSKSESRYVQTFNVIHEGIWDWNIETRAGFASDNFFEILGNDHFAFNGFETLLPYFHPDDRERVNHQFKKAVKNNKGFNIQARVVQKDGKSIHVLFRGRVVEEDAVGKPIRLLGTIGDITDQMLSEAYLRESEAKFRAIFNNNHAVMLLINPENSQIMDANPAACAYYGYSRSEMIGLKLTSINPLEQRDLLANLEAAVKENRTFFNFQHRVAGGEMRDVEVFSGPIEQNGQTILFSIVHDITARRLAEKALMENENRLRFALEGANDGLWDVNLKTGETYISPRGCQILGYTSGEIIDLIKVWDQLVNPEDLPETNRRLNDHFAGRSEVFEVEQRLQTKSGDWKWVLTRGKLVERDSEGKPVRITGTHTDITLRRKADDNIKAAQRELQRLLMEADTTRQVLLSMLEDQKVSEEKLNLLNTELEQRVRERTIQLETTNNELEAFSYSVSHDLRAPLRGIDGWSLALLEDYGDVLDEKGQLYLNRVRSETQHMSGLIDDLLRLSRVTRMELKQSKVNLSDQAHVISDRLWEEFNSNPPEFVIQPDIEAYGDAQLLEIVMTNLLANACKFSARQSSPRIEFGRVQIDGTIAYYVRDNGVGFDSSNAKKLFGAFQRMHKQTEYPGTGIGLATVKRVISRHGGKVWAESQRNQGAAFFFTLSEVR